MHRFSAALISGVSTIAITQVASAADLPQKAPPYTPPPPIYSWTGFYIGGHVGYGWGSLNGDTAHTVRVPSIGPFFPLNAVLFPSLERDINPNGGLGGIQAGYNYQAARVVYGVEADLTWTGQRDSFNFAGASTPVQFEDFDYQETTAAKLRYMGTVRGRIGYAFGEFLPYITGGLAWGRMAMDLNWALKQRFCQICVASFSGSESHTLFGWTLGAGFEYAFGPRWSVKAEYLFVDLGEKTYFAGVPGGGSFGLQDHIGRLGINFRL